MNRYSYYTFFKKAVALAAVSLCLSSCTSTDSGSEPESAHSPTGPESPQIAFRAFEDAEPGLPFEGEIAFVTGIEEEASINDKIYNLVSEDYQVTYDWCTNYADGDVIGNYVINQEESTALANQAFASVMFQVESSCSTGRISTSWISFTTAIDPTVEIFLSDILDASQAKSNDIIALVTLGFDENSESCVEEFTDSLQELLSDDDFTAWNSAFEFAVTTEGVMLGLKQGNFAPNACGAGSSIIPWSSLDGRLSEFGDQLRGSID